MKSVRLMREVEFKYSVKENHLFTNYNRISKIAISPHGQRIAALSNIHRTHYNVHVWDTSGHLIGNTVGLGAKSDNSFIEESGLAFWPDSNNILVAGVNYTGISAPVFFRTLKTWNISSNKLTYPFGSNISKVNNFRTSPSMRYVLVSGENEGSHGLFLHDTYTGTNKTLPYKDGPGMSYEFSPDESMIYIGGLEPTFVKIKDGVIIDKIQSYDNFEIHSFSPDNKYFVALPINFSENCGAKYFSIWSSLNNTIQQKVRVSKKSSLICTAKFSPNGKCLITGHKDGSISLWDAKENFQHLATKEKAHNKSIRNIISSHGDRFITSDDYELVGWRIVEP